jgi:hypothetical protein
VADASGQLQRAMLSLEGAKGQDAAYLNKIFVSS